MKRYADIRIELIIEFDDDGESNLQDQAIEAAMDKLGLFPSDFDNIEVVGEVRKTELPLQEAGR